MFGLMFIYKFWSFTNLMLMLWTTNMALVNHWIKSLLPRTIRIFYSDILAEDRWSPTHLFSCGFVFNRCVRLRPELRRPMGVHAQSTARACFTAMHLNRYRDTSISDVSCTASPHDVEHTDSSPTRLCFSAIFAWKEYFPHLHRERFLFGTKAGVLCTVYR